MNWLKLNGIHCSNQYEVEKVATKWVVFMYKGEERFPIHKAKTLTEAKTFAVRHFFRVA